MVDLPVTLGLHQRVAARLVAVRVSPEVANQRRCRLHADARRRGHAVSAERLRLADWTLLVTNVPATLLSGPEVLVVARVRWHVEVLFNLWKGEGQLAHSRRTQPWPVLCEVYAKLLALLVQHWLVVTSLWTCPERSWTQAAQTLRKQALPLPLSPAGRPWGMPCEWCSA